MKKIFFTGFLFVSLFVINAHSVSAWGGWNSGGAQTMNVPQYGYSSPIIYSPPSVYVPVQNYTYSSGNNYGGYNTYMPTYYGNNWSQGLGIGASVNLGWNTGGYMPIGYGGGFNGGWNTWGGGCSVYCYGSPVFY